MPEKQLTIRAWFYRLMVDLPNAENTFMAAIKVAGEMAANVSSEPHDIHQRDELASKTLVAKGQLDQLQIFLHFEEGSIQDRDEASSKNGGVSR